MNPRRPESQGNRFLWVGLVAALLVAVGIAISWKRSDASTDRSTGDRGSAPGNAAARSTPAAGPVPNVSSSGAATPPAADATGTAPDGAAVSKPAEAPISKPASNPSGPGVSGVTGATGTAPTPVAVVTGTASGPILLGGTVRLDGTPPAEREITPIRADRLCGALHTNAVLTRRYVVGKDRGLANVVVSLVAVPSGFAFQPPTEKPLLDQVGCVYEPPVITLTTQQVVRIRNSDPFLHNVNAQARANRGFNFAQATAGQVNEKSFAEPESGIRLICNVHPWMAASVSVFPHPFHAVTDQDGRWRFSQPLPAGRHELEFSHRTAGTRRVVVEVGAAGATPLEVSLEVPQS